MNKLIDDGNRQESGLYKRQPPPEYQNGFRENELITRIKNKLKERAKSG
jgi:hypothetical protein